MEQTLNQPAQGNGAAGADPIKETTTAGFVRDVIDASMQTPVIVDFWAPWCGPCKQLGPMLEKIVTETKGAVRMVKLNIDDNPEIAQQMRIQSIPAVFAFSAGKPVDGFAGAVPESQIREFVDKLVKTAGAAVASPVDDALAQAALRLEADDFETAGTIYSQVLQHAPENVGAATGLARCRIGLGELAAAGEALAGVPEDKRSDAEYVAARSALDLALKGEAAGDFSELQGRLDADPTDHAARFDLAIGFYAAGRKEEAVDHLVEIVRRDRAWNDGAARIQLLQLFEIEGPTSELTVDGRRKLSSVLFS